MCVSGINSVSPQIGSIGGETILTITGTGDTNLIVSV